MDDKFRVFREIAKKKTGNKAKTTGEKSGSLELPIKAVTLVHLNFP